MLDTRCEACEQLADTNDDGLCLACRKELFRLLFWTDPGEPVWLHTFEEGDPTEDDAEGGHEPACAVCGHARDNEWHARADDPDAQAALIDLLARQKEGV